MTTMSTMMQLHDIQLFNQSFVLFGRDPNGVDVSVSVDQAPTFFYLRPKDGEEDLISATQAVLMRNELNVEVTRHLEWLLEKNGGECRAMQCGCNPETFVENEFGPDMISPCCGALRELLKAHANDFVIGVEHMKGRSIIGYEAGVSEFVRVNVRTYGVLRILKSKIMKSKRLLKKWEPFELSIDPVTRFMADKNLVGGGFACVTAGTLVMNESERITRCSLEFRVDSAADIEAIAEDPGGLTNYPLRILSFDIECCSFNSKPNCFPTAKRGDPVIQIGIVAETVFSGPSGDVKTRSVVFCLSQTAAIATGEIVSFRTEKELLAAFYQYAIVEFGADVITGYNSNQFDMPYILERAEKLKLEEYRSFSKLTARSMRYWKQKFESAQAGTRITVQYNTPGMVMFDVFNYVKKTMNLRSYSLNNVAIAVLKDEKKDDMKYSDIPIFQQAGPEKRAIIAKYCLQDTVLVSKLIHVRKMLVNNIEFSRICGILLQHSIEKGVSYKILRKVLQYTIPGHYFIPTFQRNADGEQIVPYYNSIVNELAEYEDDENDENSNKQTQLSIRDMFSKTKRQNKNKSTSRGTSDSERRLKFQGAFVLDPQAGFHTDIVATLDFASLYPSEMRMHNMCPSTLLQSHAHAAALGLEQEVDFEQVASGFLFVRKSTREGVFPQIETELHAERKAAKRELKDAKASGDAMLASVLDGKQLAIKLVMNSIYGFLGSRTSAVTALIVALSITAQGRHDIMATKDWVERHFRQDFCKDAPGKANVVYGDSVIGETPVIVNYKNRVDVVSISDLSVLYGGGSVWEPTFQANKEYFVLESDVMVWSDNGWTKIRRIVRHRCEKELVKVSTKLGKVVCTTDHSLVRKSGRQVKPGNCKVGKTRLLHRSPEVVRRWDHEVCIGQKPVPLNVQLAELLGMFTGAGVSEAEKKVCWEIVHNNTILLDKYCKWLNELFGPDVEFVRNENSLQLTGGTVKKWFLQQWHRLCYFDNGERRVASELYTSEPVVQTAFLRGVQKSGELRFYGDRICQGITVLAYLSGLKRVLVFGEVDSTGNDDVVWRIGHHPRTSDSMFVYDLTTANHHFAAGVGTLVVHNTDSVMVKFEGLTDLERAFKYAEEIERRINSQEKEDGVAGLFQMPMYLEFEKVFWPYFLLKKKKYLAMKYDAGEADKPPKVDAKGIEMIRNDWAKLCTNTQKKFVDILLIDKSKEKAVAYVRDRVVDLMEGKVANEELVLSKKLSKFTYKNKQPHVEVARMLMKTDPMNAPNLGDRVEYFIGLNEHKKTAEKAYPVSMFGKVDVDYEYYLNKQLRGPMSRLLEELIGKQPTATVFTYKRSAKRRREQEEVALERLFKRIVIRK